MQPLRYLVPMVLAITAAAYAAPAPLPDDQHSGHLVSYPLQLDPQCRDGAAKLYDECTDQLELYQAAIATAISQDKILLVSYGAEWCIWCHVFDKYVRGEHSSFTHTYSSPQDDERFTSTLHERETYDVSAEAADLAAFVAEHFVLVHLEYKYSYGSDEALRASGAIDVYDNSLPFIYTVSHLGQYATKLDTNSVETRRDTDDWFRGYNRRQLTEELARLEMEARLSGEPA